MSDKLPRLTAKQLIKILKKQGWQLDRVRGSHQILVHIERQSTLSVPLKRRTMSIGTLNRLLKDAGISRKELRNLL